MSQPADSSSPPDWAIKQASAALQGGMSAPDVEHRLVAVGLAPVFAKAVLLRAGSRPSDPPPILDWAMEHVRAALRAGVSVPDIERRLVAKGLAPEVAEAVVTSILGERVRAGQLNSPQQDRLRTLHRILSFATACGCVFLAYQVDGSYLGNKAVGAALFLVFFVWFGDHIGAVLCRSSLNGGVPVPGVMVRWLDWSILAAILLFLLYFSLVFQIHGDGIL